MALGTQRGSGGRTLSLFLFRILKGSDPVAGSDPDEILDVVFYDKTLILRSIRVLLDKWELKGVILLVCNSHNPSYSKRETKRAPSRIIKIIPAAARKHPRGRVSFIFLMPKLIKSRAFKAPLT